MIKDFVSNSLRELKRNKKNKILVLIFTLLFFLLFVDLIIVKNFYEYYDYAVDRNINFRIFNVFYRNTTKSEAIAELSSVEHVSEVYDSFYDLAILNTNLTDNGENGVIALIYGSKNTAPKSIKGKNIDELATGEIICPYEFYPDSDYGNPLNIDEDKFLKGDEILSKKLVGQYYHLTSEIVDNKLVENKESLTKELKIVGLYDESIFQNGINACYGTLKDIKDIVDESTSSLKEEGAYPLHVVVDMEKNVNDVYKKIRQLGKYDISSNTVAYIDKSFVSILFSVTFIFALAIVITILLILKNYIKKKIKSQANDLGILRACGYTKKQVIEQEIIRNGIVLSFSFLLSVTCFSLIFVILEEKIFKNFKYIGFNISNNGFILLGAFIIVLVIAELMNYCLVKKEIDSQISDILVEE